METTVTTATTDGLEVSIRSRFVPEHSNRAKREFVFSYTVRIRNHGELAVQLVARHWIIRHASGEVEEVQGPGVVGEQPVLDPGETYTYSSWCQLESGLGTMKGSYLMLRSDGTRFDATIPEFTLVDEDDLH